MISYKHIKGNSEAITNYYNHLKDDVGEYYTKGDSTKIHESCSKDLRAILKENNIETEEEKIAFLSNRVRVGFDMTISFTKDVSLTALLCDDDVLKTIREVVKEKVDKINSDYIRTRKHINGEKHIVKAQALIQVFEHHTSRELDPQLHYHLFISNKVLREDGKLSSLVADEIVRDSYKINAELSYEAARRLREKGYNAFLDEIGDLKLFEDRALVEKFSRRKAQIEELARKKFGKNLKELTRNEIKELVLATRKKKYVKDIKTLHDLWREELRELGYTEKELRERVTLDRALENFDVRQGFERAFRNAVRELAEYEGVFEDRKLYKRFLIALSQYARERNQELPELSIAKRTYEKLKEERLIKVGEGLYTTAEFKLAHENAVYYALNKAYENDDTFSTKELEKAIKRYEKQAGFTLSDDQRNAIYQVAHRKLTLWNGNAGAGKTTAMEVIKQLADSKNIKTIGLTPTGKAAEELSKTFGKGQTIDSFLIEMEKLGKFERKKALDNALIVVDEAGMVDSRKFFRLMKVLNDTDAKVILSGDYKQLQPVAAGSTFSELYEKMKEDKALKNFAFAELTTIRRQKRDSYLKVTKALSEKDFKTAFEELSRKQGEYFERLDYDNVVKDFMKDPQNTLIVTSTNATKDELNRVIRSSLKAYGKLKNAVKVEVESRFKITSVEDLRVGDTVVWQAEGEKSRNYWNVVDVDRKQGVVYLARNTREGLKLTEVGLSDLRGRTAHRKEIKEFAEGDRIITLKNDRELGVKNGELFVVQKVDKNKLTLTSVNSNKKVEIPLSKYKNLDYSYAITTHKSQGMTFNRVAIVDDGRTNYNQFYVAVTRGRYDCKIYTNDIVNTLYKAQFNDKGKEVGKTLTRSEIAEKLIENAKDWTVYMQYSRYIDDFKRRKELRNKVLEHSREERGKEKRVENKRRSAMENLKKRYEELKMLDEQKRKEEERQREIQKKEEERQRKMHSLKERYEEIKRQQQQRQEEQQRQQRRNRGLHL